MICTVTILTSCIKLLLIPAYKSTDFEVHRNWLAITHSLPLKKWYFESTSEWTLDYPPLFAYFEYVLSILASQFDEKMLIVNNLNYSSRETILFQRLSVILTDLVYAYGTYKCCCSLPKSWKILVVLPILLITNCGLLMVDHIHFQYNGIMYGILLLSIAYALQGKHLKSAICFTILLNMKHIYIYLAPAYFVYLLRNYCIVENFKTKLIFTILTLKRLSLLGSIVISIFLITFLPFYDHLDQVLSRMFPFKRGLCHAYWAPNVWALYNTVDKILFTILSKAGYVINQSPVASMTGGLVQEFSHSILPSIAPIVTIVLTALMMLPAMIKLWSLPKPIHFLRCLVICALTSFLFGWHVHEKAILMAIIPMSILAVMDLNDAKIFAILALVAHYSLLPLLFTSSLLLVKILLVVLYTTYTFHSLSKIYPLGTQNFTFPLLNHLESLYILGFLALFSFETVIQKLFGINNKYPFLALMLTSVYCSLGVVYCWVRYYLYFLNINNNTSVSSNNKNKKIQ